MHNIPNCHLAPGCEVVQSQPSDSRIVEYVSVCSILVAVNGGHAIYQRTEKETDFPGV